MEWFGSGVQLTGRNLHIMHDALSSIQTTANKFTNKQHNSLISLLVVSENRKGTKIAQLQASVLLILKPDKKTYKRNSDSHLTFEK
jgi:hypothetical protein